MACWLGIALLAITGVAQAQNGLTLRGDSVEGEPGRDVTLLFRVDGFWEITQGMGTIQWDPEVMDYVSAGDFGIGAIDEGTFTRIPEGKLTFDWTSNSDIGNTLADGTVLFSLTFAVRGDPGDTTTVAFTNGWLPLHFESAESIDLPFSSVPGTVAVVPEPGTTVLLALGLAVFAAGYGRFTRRRKLAERANGVSNETGLGGFAGGIF